jgi:hypothetical protein
MRGVMIKFVSTVIVIHPWRKIIPFKNFRKQLNPILIFRENLNYPEHLNTGGTELQHL